MLKKSQGSSPRVWGQADIHYLLCSGYRIIPTRVGTSVCCRRIIACVWDHPHACGDKRPNPARLRCLIGSSPRVWGQEKLTLMKVLRLRIIPTRVGTRIILLTAATSKQDHPHACGDKIIASFSFCSMLGSSPRVWGQGKVVTLTAAHLRIIPTRVGTRRKTRILIIKSRDHPHACGDKTKEIKENSGFAKSTA